MRHHFLEAAALAAVFLTSCTQDEMVPTNRDDIRFTASTSAISRVTESFDSQTLPSSFTVWAWTSDNNTLYIPGDIASRESGQNVWSFSKSRYWPEKEGVGLDFVAFHGDVNNTFSHETKQFVDFSVNENFYEQVDLLYSVENGKQKTSSLTNLNFRHALSQICFNATLSNPTLKIEFTGITIGNVYGTGTFSLPTSTDGSAWLDGETDDASTFGTWDDLKNLSSYFVNTGSDDSHPILSADCLETTLTGANDPTKLSLIPQTTECWNPAASALEGAYVAINCTIYNSRDGIDTKLNDSPIYIPLDVDWKPGVRYTYNIEFGAGHAGYINPESPVETLTGVSMTVKTDDYRVDNGASGFYTFRILYDACPPSEWIQNYNLTSRLDYVDITLPEAPNTPQWFKFDTTDDFGEENFPFPGEKIAKFDYWYIATTTNCGTGLTEAQLTNGLQPGEVITISKDVTSSAKIFTVEITPSWIYNIYITAHFGLPSLDEDENLRTEVFTFHLHGRDDFEIAVVSGDLNNAKAFAPYKNDKGEVQTPANDLTFIGWSFTEKPNPQENAYTSKDCDISVFENVQRIPFSKTGYGRMHIYAVYGHTSQAQ